MLTLALTLLLSCGSTSDTGGPKRDPRPIEATDDHPKTVVVIVVDTLARRFMSPWNQDWDTTPELTDFFDDATVLADTQSVRGLTSVAVSSISSGVYPRIHGVRNNRDWGSPWNPILSEMFQDAGYTTLGYASNTCQFIDRGIDERMCTWSWEDPDGYGSQLARDQALITALGDSIGQHPSDEKLFVWLHMINPHDPFNDVAKWYEQFHPEAYKGKLNPSDPNQLDAWILEEHELTEEDQRQLDAVYASQVRETDRQLGEFFDTLKKAGRWDDSVILFTADHGEELGEHYSYFFHGCSAYQQTMQVASAIRAPGRLPAGQWFDTTISSTDLAPTIADLAGIGWEGYRDGETLVDEINAGQIQPRPAYFERALSTAGVVYDDHRYILDINEGFDECKPYDLSNMSFPSNFEELFDDSIDPGEQIDLSADDPDTLAAMRTLTCQWITSDVWYSENADLTHPMVTTCKDMLGITDDSVNQKGCAAVPLRAALWPTLFAMLGLLWVRRRPGPACATPPAQPRSFRRA